MRSSFSAQKSDLASLDENRTSFHVSKYIIEHNSVDGMVLFNRSPISGFWATVLFFYDKHHDVHSCRHIFALVHGIGLIFSSVLIHWVITSLMPLIVPQI